MVRESVNDASIVSIGYFILKGTFVCEKRGTFITRPL